MQCAKMAATKWSLVVDVGLVRRESQKRKGWSFTLPSS